MRYLAFMPNCLRSIGQAQLRQVHVVTNGLAILCWDQRRQFAIDLKKMSLITEFDCSALDYPLQMPWPPAVLVETTGETIDDVVDLEAQNLLTNEGTEMNMMADIRDNNIVHDSKMVSSSKLDHGDGMIHPNQMAVHGNEMVRGVETTHTTKVAPPTASRHGSKMVPSSEMAQGMEMTHGNDTAEAAPPTTARRQRKQSIIWEHFTTKVDSDGCTQACCNYCKRTFAYSSGSKCAGTSHLKRHITLGSCPVMKGQGTDNGGQIAAEKPSKRPCAYVPFNQNGSSSYLARMINVTEPLTTKKRK
uniref:BED-type domain-containing protein n=1 Tax=Arundo donax TaxID=35708 RepID=A0A0A9DPD7_ARUDO